jgi:hypothetical protein
VRVSVKPFSPRSFQSFKPLYSELGFMVRVSVKPFKYSAFCARKPARPEVPLVARRRRENVPARWRWNSRPGLES